MSLYCSTCGQLNHVGLAHVCDQPDQVELVRRLNRAKRATDRANAEALFGGLAEAMRRLGEEIRANVKIQMPRTYTVIPEPPLDPPHDTSPIRVQAYVGYPLAQIEAAGQTVIDGELT